jgi:hypothetical protein
MKFYYLFAIECTRKNDLEDKIKNHPLLLDKHIPEYEGKDRKELIRISKDFSLDKLIKLIKSIKDTLEVNNVLLLEQEKIKFELEKMNIETKSNIEIEQEKTKQIESQSRVNLEKEKTRQLEISLELKKLEFEMELQKYRMNNNANSELVNVDNNNLNEIDNEELEDEDGDEDLEDEINPNDVINENRLNRQKKELDIRPEFFLNPTGFTPLNMDEHRYKKNFMNRTYWQKGCNAAASYVSQIICSTKKFNGKYALIKKNLGTTDLQIALDEMFDVISDVGKRQLKEYWKSKTHYKGFQFTPQELYDACIRYLHRRFPDTFIDDSIYIL